MTIPCHRHIAYVWNHSREIRSQRDNQWSFHSTEISPKTHRLYSMRPYMPVWMEKLPCSRTTVSISRSMILRANLSHLKMFPNIVISLSTWVKFRRNSLTTRQTPMGKGITGLISKLSSSLKAPAWSSNSKWTQLAMAQYELDIIDQLSWNSESWDPLFLNDFAYVALFAKNINNSMPFQDSQLPAWKGTLSWKIGRRSTRVGKSVSKLSKIFTRIESRYFCERKSFPLNQYEVHCPVDFSLS